MDLGIALLILMIFFIVIDMLMMSIIVVATKGKLFITFSKISPT